MTSFAWPPLAARAGPRAVRRGAAPLIFQRANAIHLLLGQLKLGSYIRVAESLRHAVLKDDLTQSLALFGSEQLGQFLFSGRQIVKPGIPLLGRETLRVFAKT